MNSFVGFDLWRHKDTVHWSEDCPAYRRIKIKPHRSGHWDWAASKPKWIIEQCFTREDSPLHQCRKCWPAEAIV